MTAFSRKAHVVVVGSGIGGLVAALTASARHAVTLVTKAELEDSNTRYAQGGIAAAVFADDSVDEHVADTLRAGAGLNILEAVEVLCAEGPDRIHDLIRFGVEFDRDASDPSGARLARGLEAAHSRARVLHAGGDATGAVIERALVAAVRAAGVEIMENTFLADLAVDGGRVVGIDVVDVAVARTATAAPPPALVRRRIAADAVILASGGAGQLFLHTTNPEVATGDGAAAAWRAGAQLADVEFYQFHPTALALPGNFLVSEAVRGEGATLLSSTGERFMLAVHPDAELAPRDVVARGIAEQMASQGGTPVLLDATALGAEFLRTRFPTIDAACRAAGIDWSREPVPVTPAAHYWMGGIATDTRGRTSLPGLYAVGEVACTGAHGANRLASNSLLESAVLAHRSASVVGDEAELSWSASAGGNAFVANDGGSHDGDAHEGDSHEEGLYEVDVAAASIAEPLLPFPEVPPVLDVAAPLPPAPFSRAALQELLWQCAGVHRSAAGLAAAADVLERWEASATQASATDLSTATSTSIRALEDANLLALGRIIVDAAQARRESRGAHFRSDYPTVSPEFARHTVWARKVLALC
jgi:L-aspartate oxidase